MGFDIYGMNPQTDKPAPPQPSMKGGEWTDKEREQWDKYEEWRQEAGGYFRNNVWWWRPLWKFVCGVCDDILTDADRGAGEFNEKEYKKYIDSLSEDDWSKSYPFSIDNVRAFATFCSKCGGFEIC